jgi:4-amino-4-deoxy-L-arabinose transferase-like glycosyltransferase
VAALLYAWNITRAGYAPLYAQAVRSMSQSWMAFLYGAADPKATITLDKLAGAFLPQALSARIFGYHAWSLALPQVVEGVISVLVMYRVVRRWAGVVPGLLASAIFALTPVAASMFGHSMEDGALTMCLVLAADAYQRAVLEARLRWLVLAGVWVGLGFQAKMLQAWLVLPALAIGYLLTAPITLRRRLGQLGLAGLVMLAVSLSWIALYTFTPAHDRPYISGSTDNSAVAMVFGYNGLSRFGLRIPGAAPVRNGISTFSFGPHRVERGGGTGPGPASGTGTGQPAAGSGTGERHVTEPGTGWAKLLGGSFGAEIGWLYPLALLALAAGLLRGGRPWRRDPIRGGFVMWGVWLLSFGLVFSKMSVIPHTAYLAALAPPLAALSAAGIVMFWRAYQAGEPGGWLLPLATALEMAWSAWLWWSYRGFFPWVLWALLAVGTAAIVIMALRRHRPGGRLATIGLAAAVAAMLAAPSVWALSVLDPKYAGSSFDAAAGPVGGGHCVTQPTGSAGGRGPGHSGRFICRT